jgi:hypothetical protein
MDHPDLCDRRPSVMLAMLPEDEQPGSLFLDISFYAFPRTRRVTWSLLSLGPRPSMPSRLATVLLGLPGWAFGSNGCPVKQGQVPCGCLTGCVAQAVGAPGA